MSEINVSQRAADPQLFGELRTSALELAQRGFPVFPVWSVRNGECTCGKRGCPNAGKHPIGELCPKGCKDATADADKIAGCWTYEAPGANIGIALPPGIVVVDVDPRNGGDESFAELEDQLPDTLTCQTGGGGRHLYFRAPLNAELPGKLAPGIDLKQHGGYVLAPPSVHKSGGVYRWALDLPIADAPDWLLKPTTPRPAVAVEPRLPGSASTETTDYGVAALEGEAAAVQGAEPGTQEQTLNTAALKIGSYIAGGEIAEADARAVLLEAGLAMRTGDPRNPWTEQQILAKIDRGFRDGAQTPRSAKNRGEQNFLAAIEAKHGAKPAAADLDVTDHIRGLPLIVQKQGVYWMRDTSSDDYTRRCVESDLVVNARDQYGIDTLKAWKNSDDERIGKATIEKQSRSVQAVVACYFASKTTYDPETGTLTQGLRVDPTLRPLFDANVEAWLAALAGERIESLRKWIAGTRNDYLRAPSRALAIIGPKDTGKSLMAYGLARIWGRGPVDAIALCSRFNGSLMRCPAVLADEQLPPDLTGEAFRKQIVARKHEIEPKGKEKQDLLGAVRLVVAVNDISKLYLAGDKGTDDVAAIADRFVVLRIAPGAAALCIDALRPLKDPKDPSGSSIDLERLAQHFLWIQQNVEPDRGRFIGAAEDADAEDVMLAAELDKAPELFELIRSFLAAPDQWQGKYKLNEAHVTPKRGDPAREQRTNFPLVMKDGRLYVRTEVLAALAGQETVFVGRALKPFKTGARNTTLRLRKGTKLDGDKGTELTAEQLASKEDVKLNVAELRLDALRRVTYPLEG